MASSCVVPLMSAPSQNVLSVCDMAHMAVSQHNKVAISLFLIISLLKVRHSEIISADSAAGGIPPRCATGGKPP